LLLNGSVTVLCWKLAPAYNSFRFGSRTSRDLVARKRISSMGAYSAPIFQVATVPLW